MHVFRHKNFFVSKTVHNVFCQLNIWFPHSNTDLFESLRWILKVFVPINLCICAHGLSAYERNKKRIKIIWIRQGKIRKWLFSFHLICFILFIILFNLFTILSFKNKTFFSCPLYFDPGLELAMVKLQVKNFMIIYNLLIKHRYYI